MRPAFKFAFAMLLQALALMATYTSSAVAFSESDLRHILVLGGAVNTVLLLGALLLHRFNKAIANIVLALIVLAGVATAYLVHTDLYLVENRAVFIPLCAAAAVGLFVAFRVIDEQRWGGVALSAATLLGFGIVGTQLPTDKSVEGDVSNTDKSVEGDVSNIRHISFQTTPNLYFVSFESLHPPSLLDKNLGVEAAESGFHRLFDAHFRRFRNFFANDAPTTASLTTLLALDTDVYYSMRRELKDRGDSPNPFLFSGQNPSPLLGILHRNSYETTSIYATSFLGSIKGPYIDNFATFERETLCNLLGSGSSSQIAFWGYCQIFHDGGGRNAAASFIVDQITKTNTNKGPQFVMAHISSPDHTNKGFRYDNTTHLLEFKAFYIEALEKSSHYLTRIIGHLKQNDPNAILLVYGDHGPWLSRGLKFEDNREFVFQDRYGILGGVYPPDVCANELDKASAKGYMTILDAVHAILRCLSGGESALVEPREYRFPGYLPGRVFGDVVPPYKEFLYE